MDNLSIGPRETEINVQQKKGPKTKVPSYTTRQAVDIKANTAAIANPDSAPPWRATAELFELPFVEELVISVESMT